MMKTIITLITFLLSTTLYAATCTSTSRTNYTVNQVLTSTALNADFNQLVTKANAMDAGCLTDGTLESSALDTSFNALKNGLHQGCGISYVDTNTISVGYCILSVSGNFVKTTANTNVTWGCSSCSSEVVSTQYYVYAKTSSTGSTLNLLISTTAPNGDGLDGTGNKALGSFYNNSSSNINFNSVLGWQKESFSPLYGKLSVPGVATHSPSFVTSMETFSFTYGVASPSVSLLIQDCTGTCQIDQIGNAVSSMTNIGIGEYSASLNRSYTKIKCTGSANSTSWPVTFLPISTENSSSIIIKSMRTDIPSQAYSHGAVNCVGF